MEFNGLQAADFDFFKKKEKMTKEEYERGRNDVKLHFRGLCYEMQKIHHSRTGGVLVLDKDFQNFNKKSSNISADHNVEESRFKIAVQLSLEQLTVEAYALSAGTSDAQELIDILKNKKSIIWDLTMSDKYILLYAEIMGKDKKSNYMKLSSLEINTRNYDNFTGFIEDNLNKGKANFKLGIGYAFPRTECLKQGKNMAGISYDAMSALFDFLKKIG